MAGKKRALQDVKTKWVTIRLTEKEKEVITKKAQRAGAKDTCTFLRQTILSEITKPLHQYGETA
jgi:hypothetical protein